MSGPDIRECGRLAGEVAVDLYEQFWGKIRYRYGSPGTEYEPLSSEDYDAMGFPQDDPYLTILRRKPDGQLFEIEIEVTALAVDPPQPPAAEIPGQQPLPIGGEA